MERSEIEGPSHAINPGCLPDAQILRRAPLAQDDMDWGMSWGLWDDVGIVPYRVGAYPGTQRTAFLTYGMKMEN